MNTDQLRDLAKSATAGPWEPQDFEYTVHTGAVHTGHGVCTVWWHGQLQGPAPVVGTGISVRPHPVNPEDLAVQETVWVSQADAKYIAAANPQVILQLIEEHARYKAALESITKGSSSNIKSPLGPLHAAGMACQWEIDAKISRAALEERLPTIA